VSTDPQTQPWHGVLVATALPYTADLEVDFDRFAEHVAWLAASGCDGITPNGSLGEYQVLTPEERARVVETSIAAAPPGFSVIPGVAAYGARESARLAEHAASAGAAAPTSAPCSSTTAPSPPSACP
jgi:dihydrodipicolinate synthase/N-acetylneuraminate lyase